MTKELNDVLTALKLLLIQAQDEGRMYLLKALAVTILFMEEAVRREEEYERINRA